MSALEFNLKAKFVYTKLLPLLKEATRNQVDSVNYAGAEDEETVLVSYTDGSAIAVDVTGSTLTSLAMTVLEALN